MKKDEGEKKIGLKQRRKIREIRRRGEERNKKGKQRKYIVKWEKKVRKMLIIRKKDLLTLQLRDMTKTSTAVR